MTRYVLLFSLSYTLAFQVPTDMFFVKAYFLHSKKHTPLSLHQLKTVQAPEMCA